MSQEKRASITKQTKVREALEAVDIQPCVVPMDEDIRATVERLSQRPGVRTVAVVDKEGRLVGVLTMRVLLDELFLTVAPEEFLVDMRQVVGVEEFGRIVRARTAGDLMLAPVWVSMEDSLRDAFIKMHEHNLGGLPIVDEGMKVVGYLDRFHLIRLWLKGQKS